MEITKLKMIGANFAYSFYWDDVEIIMEAFEDDDNKYIITLFAGDEEEDEFAEFTVSNDDIPIHNIDAWLIVQNNAHTVIKQLWRNLYG